VLKRGEHSYFVDLERKVPLPPLRSGRLEQAPSRLSLPTLHSPSGSSAPPKFPRASKAASESKSATSPTPIPMPVNPINPSETTTPPIFNQIEVVVSLRLQGPR